MSIEYVLFISEMLCPYCIKFLKRKGSYFYCDECGRLFDSDYSITKMGETNVNNIKLVEVKENKEK